jgi:localization factor PodJL
MRPVVPWSVKGIEPEAREAAKQAARRAGMTLGAWLNHVIMDNGTDDAASMAAGVQDFSGLEAAPSQPAPPGVDAAGPQAFMHQSAYAAPQMPPMMQPQIDLSPVTEAVRDLVRRIDTNERHIDNSLAELANRVETSEQLLASGAQTGDAGLEHKMQQLTERLEQSERTKAPFGKRSEDRIALQSLEKTMNAVVDHLETSDTQSEQKFSEIRQLLNDLTNRVDNSDAEAERQQEQAKSEAFGNTLQNLSERMAEMEQSVHSVGANADQSRRQAVEEAVQAVSAKLDSDQQRSKVDDLQHSIAQLAKRIDHSEVQSANSIKALEGSFSGFIERLEQNQVSASDIVPEVMAQLDGRLNEVVSRVTDSETRALETASSVEQALSSLAHTVASAEHRNAEARETVHSMVAQVSERMESLEAGAGLPLSPTVAVGAGLAGIAPPPLSSAPPPPPGPMVGPQAEAFGSPLPEPKSEVRAPEPTPPVAPAPPLVGAGSPPPLPALGDMPPPPPPISEPTLGADARLPGEPPIATPAPGLGTTPPPNEKKAARDFIAAARRAAQMSQTSGEQAPGLGFGEPSSRYAAFEEQEDNRGKRLAILIGGAVAAIVLVLVVVNWLAAPANRDANADIADQSGIINGQLPLDETNAADPFVDAPVSQSEALVPDTIAPIDSAPLIPEAIPEDVDSLDAAEASTSTPSTVVAARPAPAPLPEPRAPATSAPRSIVPNATDLPPVDAAPTTPVTQAPRNALRSAAASGNPAAQYEIGLRYAQGSGVPQDYDQAAYWFELAAKQNLAIAQYRLATLFEKGRGVSQDQEQARAWYESAAQAGNVKAMHNLAVIYAEGKGVPQDFAKAGQWFLAAADHGLADSQYNVAVLFERGLGLDEDLATAFKWFAIAANNGDDGAVARRDAIADKLDASILVDAKLAAQTWGAKPADQIANGNLSSLGNWRETSLSDTSSSPARASSAVADPSIAKAQRLLRELGYQPGPADGLMGPRTRDAIRDFQSKAGLDVSGSVDEKLLNTLEAYVR